MERTDTAHAVWNDTWQSEQGRARWLEPDHDVAQAIARLSACGRAMEALDLGCGVGRHALAMAEAGLRTTAMDASPAGLAECRRSAQARGLPIETAEGLMTQLPFADAAFDYVLSFNVIYHGDPAIVARAVKEIARVLKPGGLFQGTLLSKRNAAYGVGREIAPNTFVQDGGAGDKSHPHFYCDARELVDVLAPFELLRLYDSEHDGVGSGHFHWHFEADRRAAV